MQLTPRFRVTCFRPIYFSGQLTVGLFDFYELLTIWITEGTLTTIETEDFYQNLFWNLFPMPHLECTLTTKDAWGKQTCSGSYRLGCNSPEKIKQVTLTYFSGGNLVWENEKYADIF